MKYILSVITALILIWGSLTVYADNGGKSIMDLSMSEIDSNQDMKFITEEYERQSIQCYAVGEESIAIGLEDSINIYSLNGDFLYGIKFKLIGNSFLEYDKKDLYLYVSRSHKCYKISGFQKSVYCYSVKDTVENYEITAYMYDNALSDKSDNYATYTVEGINNTKLIKISNDNNEMIIYDSTSKNNSEIIMLIIGVVIFSFVIMGTIINKENKNIRKR